MSKVKASLQSEENVINLWESKTIEQRNTALYNSTSIPNAIDLYVNMLMESDELKDLVHAEAIQKYRDEIVNKKYLSRLRRTFNETYSLINQQYKDLCYSIEGRRKSFISADNKIMKIIKEILLSSKNQSEEFTKILKELKTRSLIKDTHAFRIILFNSSTETLYSLKDDIIKHFEAKGSTLLQEKDYVKAPKPNGYKSIHLIVKSSTSEIFEIQFRTFGMHMECETGSASHSVYKPKDTSFNKKKIKIPGYGISETSQEDGSTLIEEFDFVGLAKSLQILKRQMTYSL